MRNLAFWVEKQFQNDEIFNLNGRFNRNNALIVTVTLQKAFEQKGWNFHTQDYYLSRNIVPDAVLFLENPRKPLNKILSGDWKDVRPYLIICECEVIRPDNWKEDFIRQFYKIFTWKEDWIDNKRFFWTKDSPCLIRPSILSFDLSKKKKLCVLINSNKKVNHPLELYSKRVESIDWFEANHSDQFDLYGFGWDRYHFSKWPWRIFNKIPWIGRLCARKHPCYRGMVKNKFEVMSHYRFAICFENAKDIVGYFTEKIFDCFTAGCVPIYWGAPNIADHIPKDCFIDFTRFDSNDDLYRFLVSMSDEEYLGYLKRIADFTSSHRADKFRKEYFAETVSSLISGDFL